MVVLISGRIGKIVSKKDKASFLKELKNMSLNTFLSNIKDPAQKLKYKGISRRVRKLEFSTSSLNSFNDKAIGLFTFEFKEFPTREEMKDFGEYWSTMKVNIVYDPESGVFIILGAKEENIRILIRKIIKFSFDKSLSTDFKPSVLFLEKIFDFIVNGESDEIGNSDLVRSIFRNVNISGESLEEINLKAKQLYNIKLFQRVLKGSKYWHAATYKIIGIGRDKPATFRIDQYGKLLFYIDDFDHWLISYVIKVIFEVISSLD